MPQRKIAINELHSHGSYKNSTQDTQQREKQINLKYSISFFLFLLPK